MGLSPEDYAEDAFGVWPDNYAAASVFTAVSGQWRVSGGTAYALDYGVLPDVFRMTGIPRKDWSDIFNSIRIMEDAALVEIRKK